MKQLGDILGNYLAEQVALEERLYKQIEVQLQALDSEEFADVGDLLNGVKTVLGKHFTRLNGELDRLEERLITEETGLGEGASETVTEMNARWTRTEVSRILRDDYAALNAAAMGNTLLHTAAMAADSKMIAEVALEHLANITQLLMQMNELTPIVVTRELLREFPTVEAAVGEIAAKNALLVWRGKP